MQTGRQAWQADAFDQLLCDMSSISRPDLGNHIDGYHMYLCLIDLARFDQSSVDLISIIGHDLDKQID